MKNKLLVTEQDKVQFRAWLEALRSGNYSQTRHRLQDEDGYCCLGVACEIVIPKNLQVRYTQYELEENSDLECELGNLSGCLPQEYQENCPEWLAQVNDAYAKRNGLNSLVARNDNDKWSFTQIADSLEETFKDELI